MKRVLSLALVALLTTSAFAETIKTVVFTPTPKLTCANCEKKIKSNIRFVDGTKKIVTSIKDNTVTITYDADKAKIEDYVAAFDKIQRKVDVKEEAKKAETKK